MLVFYLFFVRRCDPGVLSFWFSLEVFDAVVKGFLDVEEEL